MNDRAVDVVERVGAEEAAADGRRRRLRLAAGGLAPRRRRLGAGLDEPARLVTAAGPRRRRRSRARRALDSGRRRILLDDGPVAGRCVLVHLPADDRPAAVPAVRRDAAVFRRDGAVRAVGVVAPLEAARRAAAAGEERVSE